jgi:hypothetical protein
MLRPLIHRSIKALQLASLRSSIRERREVELKENLEAMIPSLVDQYTTFAIPPDDRFLNEKLRAQHTFQISVLLKAIQFFQKLRPTRKEINLIDIGDSSGTHLLYLIKIGKKQGLNLNTMSVNLDPEAVAKIKSKGLSSVLCRAEELHKVENGIIADIFILLETLEHLFDPITFLHTMATKSECQYLVVTVPYLKRSRMGLHHLRQGGRRDVFAENTHIFELSPPDWRLMFSFAGWKVEYEDLYTQYPVRNPLNMTKYLWRKYDFEGFYGVILSKDLSKSKLYKNW